VQQASNAAALEWSVGLTDFAHPTIASVSVLGQVLGPFIFAACMFGFVIQISAVVMEKEAGLKQVSRGRGREGCGAAHAGSTVYRHAAAAAVLAYASA
jgi:hypothetical protein